MRHIGIAVGVMLALSGHNAVAQDGREAVRGQAFAQRVCTECHAVQPHAAKSPNADAPPFAVIAQVAGITAMALTVSLQGAHRKMPDIILTRDETQDVIAYILSLRVK